MLLILNEMSHKYNTAQMQRCTHSRFFVESRAHFEQTYFSTLTAQKYGNKPQQSCTTVYNCGDKYYPP